MYRRLKKKIEYHTFAITHSGEFSKGVFDAIEWLTTEFRRMVYRDPASARSAFAIKDRTAIFRTTIKDSVTAAVVEGFGRQLRLACTMIPSKGDSVELLDRHL